MGDVTPIEFSQQGYRQLVKALREARPTDEAVGKIMQAADLPQLAADGEVAYLDQQGNTRWVPEMRIPEVPKAWRPLLVGPPRA